MQVKVIKLDKVLFSGEAVKVVLPSKQFGEMCLLPHHISIVTLMGEGKIKIFATEDTISQEMQINGGVCSLSNGIASLMLCEE